MTYSVLKVPLNPNQPTNQPWAESLQVECELCLKFVCCHFLNLEVNVNLVRYLNTDCILCIAFVCSRTSRRQFCRTCRLCSQKNDVNCWRRMLWFWIKWPFCVLLTVACLISMVIMSFWWIYYAAKIVRYECRWVSSGTNIHKRATAECTFLTVVLFLNIISWHLSIPFSTLFCFSETIWDFAGVV